MSSPTDEDAWNRLLYSEAWKQYCHEDNLGQRRNNLYIGVHSALLALLTLIAKPLLELQPTPVMNGNVNIHLGMAVFGIFIAVIGAFSLILDSYWIAVIESGRGYLNIRWCTVMAIENKLALQHYGPASLEDKWRTFSRDNPDRKYKPFPEPDALKAIDVPPLPEIRGWSSMRKVVTVFQKLHWAVVVIGLLLVVLSLCGAC